MNEIYNKAFCNVRLRKREAFYFCLFVGEYLFCYREKKEPPWKVLFFFCLVANALV